MYIRNNHHCFAMITCILDDSGVQVVRRGWQGWAMIPVKFQVRLLRHRFPSPQRRNTIDLSIILIDSRYKE